MRMVNRKGKGSIYGKMVVNLLENLKMVLDMEMVCEAIKKNLIKENTKMIKNVDLENIFMIKRINTKEIILII